MGNASGAERTWEHVNFSSAGAVSSSIVQSITPTQNLPGMHKETWHGPAGPESESTPHWVLTDHTDMQQDLQSVPSQEGWNLVFIWPEYDYPGTVLQSL